MIVLELATQIVCNKIVECSKFVHPLEMNRFKVGTFKETLGSQNS
jgi:hypothetical protein